MSAGGKDEGTALAELVHPVVLCDLDRPGFLNPDAVGWSRTPLHRCNLSKRWPRKKRWNYWAFTNETHLFSMTVSNVDYLGLVFLYVADFERGTVVEDTVVLPFGRGCELPENVGDDVAYESNKVRLGMTHGKVDGLHVVDFTAEMPGFGGVGLEAALRATYPQGHETLNVLIPWSLERFQFTAKHNTLPVTGSVRLGGGSSDAEVIEFGSEQSFATLDFGRGVWPTKSAWNWGSASGARGGRRIGLNLGGKWTDGTGQTENGIVVDGRLVKVNEDLVWDYDPGDWMRPWRITTPQSDDIDVEFTSRLERVATTNAIVLKSEVHQLFGTYRGTVRGPDGEPVTFDGLVGWAEEHKATW